MSDFISLNGDTIHVNLDNISFIEVFTKEVKNEEDNSIVKPSYSNVYFTNSDKFLILSGADTEDLEKKLFGSPINRTRPKRDDDESNNNGGEDESKEEPDDESGTGTGTGIEIDPVVK